jgi:hypothetical protein
VGFRKLSPSEVLREKQYQTPYWRAKSDVGTSQSQRQATHVCNSSRSSSLYLAHEPHLVQRLLCTAPRRYAHPYNEPCPVPCAQVSRENRAGVPPTSGELSNQRHDRTAVYRYAEWRPEVARRLFFAIFATATYLTAGRGTLVLLSLCQVR